MLNRLQPILIAGLMPLLIFSWFTSTVTAQIDFWLLWLLAMVLVGLPMVFAEIALAHRSGNSPLVALPKLTREADVGTFWRLLGWLTMILLTLVNAHLLNTSANLLTTNLASPVLLAILLLAMMALSFLKHIAGWLALSFAMIGLVINLAHVNLSAWQFTATSMTEWSLAVVLALVSVGAGTGLFWHTRSHQLLLTQNQPTSSQPKLASKQVLPIWGLQLLIGSAVAINHTVAEQAVSSNQICYGLAAMTGAGYLLHLLSQQISLHLKQKTFDFLTLVLLSIFTCAFAFLPTTWLNHGLMLMSFITAVWLAIFVGWQMKISHLRKSLNFRSEIIYNVWRVAVRIIIPIAVLFALIGWFQGLI